MLLSKKKTSRHFTVNSTKQKLVQRSSVQFS